MANSKLQRIWTVPLPNSYKKRLIQDSRRTALKLIWKQPALGPMFKRIFRPKHKLFKNQPNTNIMLFIFVPSPTRPSQKKNWKIPEKALRSFQQGTVFHIFLHGFLHLWPRIDPFQKTQSRGLNSTQIGVWLIMAWMSEYNDDVHTIG